MDREELNKEAEELGLKVDGRWSDERVQSEIDKLLNSEPEEADKLYSPTGKGRLELCGVEIVECFSVSDALSKNEKFMAKFNHAIKCGLINELTK